MDLLYEGDRLTAKHSPPQIGRDGQVAAQFVRARRYAHRGHGISARGKTVLLTVDGNEPDQIELFSE